MYRYSTNRSSACWYGPPLIRRRTFYLFCISGNTYEKKLIGYSFGLGIVLLGILVLCSYTLVPVQH
uniref:Uncharacterized protein n=1 Tax=Ammonifex degensii TaxID=42838 RepID=A0A7C2E344_9THEO